VNSTVHWKSLGYLTLGLAISTAIGCATTREPATTASVMAQPPATEQPTASTTRASSTKETMAVQEKVTEAASKLTGNATEESSMPGTFSWQELTTPNISDAKGFYRTLFGWNTSDVPQEDGSKSSTYTILKVGDEEIGGIVAIQNPQEADVAYWTPYITVENVDATARRAQELGGTVLVPPTDVPDVGRYSVIQDPQGAEFSVIRYAAESE
jgi:predicted enzyme related to lactoylglutathione lyase